MIQQIDHRGAPGGGIGYLGGESLGQDDGRAQIGRHVPVPQLAGQGADAVILEQGGVVDQEGQGADSPGGLGDQAARLILVGQVGVDRLGSDAEGAQLGRQVARLIGAAAMVDGHVMAGAGQGQAEGAPDPPAATGNQRPARRGLSQSVQTRNS